MNIEVRMAGNEELKNWDALIEASPYGTIFHLFDCRPFKWLGFQANSIYSYLLDISVGLPDIKSNFSIPARRNLKKSKKGWIEYRIGFQGRVTSFI